MNKKRILFLMPSMFIGGAERSLLGLLGSLDTERYDVDLFLYRHEGEFMAYIPEGIHLLPPMTQYATFDVSVSSLLKNRHFLFGAARVFGKLRLTVKEALDKSVSGVWPAMQYISRSLLPLLPRIPGHYDAAVSFLGIPDVLLRKVDADVKIAWNHTDYSILHPDRRYDRKLYSKLDYVASVSDRCREQFLSVYPEFESKAITVQNLISADLIRKQAEEPIDDMPVKDGEAVLLSVGRFCEAKNFDSVPRICRLIREKGCPVKWYLIGFGGDEALIRQKIAEEGMEDYVIILGKKENPYPYIKRCTLYVQPSRYEGKCVSVIEAQILHKPVVITDYATSRNQLTDGVDGVIVPMDSDGCAEGIVSLLSDPARRCALSANTEARDYTNRDELEKLLSYLSLD